MQMLLENIKYVDSNESKHELHYSEERGNKIMDAYYRFIHSE